MLYSKEHGLWKIKAEISFSAQGITLSLHLTVLFVDFCLNKGSGAGKMAQQLRTLYFLLEDSCGGSQPTVCNSRRSNVLFWPSQAPYRHGVHRHK